MVDLLFLVFIHCCSHCLLGFCLVLFHNAVLIAPSKIYDKLNYTYLEIVSDVPRSPSSHEYISQPIRFCKSACIFKLQKILDDFVFNNSRIYGDV